MTLSSRLKRVALFVHVVTSVGAIGAVLCFLMLAGYGLVSENNSVKFWYPAGSVIALQVILPLLLLAFLSGIIESFITAWGLFQHYWVIFKLFLTLSSIGVLLLQVPSIKVVSSATEHSFSSSNFADIRSSMVLHSVGGLAVLLVVVLLSVFKPRGLTPIGWRKHQG